MNDETKTMLAAVADRTVAALLLAVLDEVAGLRLRLATVERRMGEVGGKGAAEPLGTPAAEGTTLTQRRKGAEARREE